MLKAIGAEANAEAGDLAEADADSEVSEPVAGAEWNCPNGAAAARRAAAASRCRRSRTALAWRTKVATPDNEALSAWTAAVRVGAADARDEENMEGLTSGMT